MAQFDGENKGKNGKKLALLVALCVLLGLLVLLLCLGTLTYFGVVELPFMNTMQQSADADPDTGYGEAAATEPSQTEDPTQSTQAHTHTFLQQQEVETTCTQGGYTLMACDCGESREENPVQALGHSYESKVTAAGTVYTCTRCEDTYTEANDNTDNTGDQSQKGEPSLNKTDITFAAKGESFVLRLRYQDGEEIKNATWTIGDPAIASVEDGKVTIISAGKTTVTATYNGKTYTCVVRGKASVGTGTEEAVLQLNKTDVTLDKGQTVKLSLTDESGKAASGVTWSVSNAAVATVKDGNVTAVSAGTVTVTATCNGKSYQCTVRVRDSGNSGNTGSNPAEKEDDDISIPITPGGVSGLVENGVIDFDDLWEQV